MMDWTAELQIVGHVLLACLFGGAIGLERELAGKAAGLRTHMMVAAASALLMSLAPTTIDQIASSSSPELVGADPTRIMQAIITGISFLGAGTIIVQRGRSVEGLTTAASILLVAALGMTTALGAWRLAAIITGLTLLILGGIGLIEQRIARYRLDNPPKVEPDPED
jgi:putative Mg2+ transporter-C (MgtC) family protein